MLIIKKIVYYDYGGCHSSIVAANLHVGKLDPHKTPDKEELMGLEFFDKTTNQDFGRVKYVGCDREGNQVYSLGTRNSNSGNLLWGLVDLEEVSPQFAFFNTMPFVNNILRLGGWLSRSVSLPFLGRPLVIRGITKDYPKIGEFVKNIQATLGEANI